MQGGQRKGAGREFTGWAGLTKGIGTQAGRFPNPIPTLLNQLKSEGINVQRVVEALEKDCKTEMTLPGGVTLESVNTDYGNCDISQSPVVTCSLIDLSVDSADAISHVSIDVDVTLEDAGLLLLTSEAKVIANKSQG
jgi:hypothetical protein